MNSLLFALLGLLVGGLIVGLYLAWRARLRRAHMLDAARRGKALEAQAPALLLDAGYRVVEDQAQVRYEFLVDGEVLPVILRADFVAERDGRRFVVEVKSGEAARPTRRETRRQLLEYCLHYPVDGVLLLDVEAQRLSTVEFPRSRAEVLDRPAPPREPVPARRWLFLLVFLAGAAVADGLMRFMR